MLGKRTVGVTLLLALLFVLAVGCSGRRTSKVQMPGSNLPSDRVELETRLLAEINRERQQRSLPALESDLRLAAAARAHSRDMAQGAFFDHRGSDGAQAGERIAAQGYDWLFYAENIACGQRSADEVLTSWMESKAHRDNLLHADAEDAGVGVAVNEQTDCRIYWTALFGSERQP